MKKTILTLIIFSFVFMNVNSQTIFGKWNSNNEETGKIDSVVEIYEKNGKAYAKIIEIKDTKSTDAICESCTGTNKDKPILGLEILTGLEKDDDVWSGGEILDPRTGKIYKCYIKLANKNKLKIRGFIGVSLFGSTR